MADAERMIRARIDDPDVLKRWLEMLDKRGVTQQRALSSLVAWIVDQDSILQLMLFGQTEHKDKSELAKLVLKRFRGGK